jgi:ribonuclease HI
MQQSLVPNRSALTLPPVPSNQVVIVATDGSCVNNPGGASGWAWFVDERSWSAGGIASGTNQQAELMAILAALRGIPGDVPLQVRTDSQYALNACTKWIPGWKAKEWKRSDGKPVANVTLMRELDHAIAARTAPLTFQWVRGHNEDPLNERADALCSAAAQATRRNATVSTGPGWTRRETVSPEERSAPAALFDMPAEPAPQPRAAIEPLFPQR